MSTSLTTTNNTDTDLKQPEKLVLSNIADDKCKWREATKFPYKYLSEFLCMNSNEFLIIPQQGEGIGVMKYDTIKDDWTKLISYPTGWKSTCHSASYDTKNEMIYICNNLGLSICYHSPLILDL